MTATPRPWHLEKFGGWWVIRSRAIPNSRYIARTPDVSPENKDNMELIVRSVNLFDEAVECLREMVTHGNPVKARALLARIKEAENEPT